MPSRLFARLTLLDSPYPAAAVLALLVVNAISIGTEPGPRGSDFLGFVLCLALGLGTVLGTCVHGAFALLRRLPRGLAFALWTLASLGAGGFIAQGLGTFARWGGRYHGLASVVLAACSLAALTLSLLLGSMQPTAAHPRGFLPMCSRRVRSLAAIVVFVGAAVVGVADRKLYIGLYPHAHAALRFTSALLVMFSIAVLDRELRLPRLSPAALGAVVLAGALVLVGLDERRHKALHAFEVRTWPSLLLDTARNLVDVDRDGYPSLLAGGDCAPLDPRVSPHAREIPDNGIDDNCMLGDAKHKIERIEELPLPSEPSPLSVVLITIDSLNPEHLGVYSARYGKEGRAVSPNLDRFAERATVFERAYTSGGWTSVAIPSLMRGLYPRRLRWIRHYETNRNAMVRGPLDKTLRPGERAERVFPFAFDDPHPPLAQRLKHRGMSTAAVVDDGYSEIMRAGLGIESGFGVFRTTDSLPYSSRNDAGTVNLALSTMRQLPKDRPFFLWVHLFGPHGPDQIHADVRKFGTRSVDLYDHEIAFVDRELGRLLAALDARKDPLAVIVAADHGEAFYRNIHYHGHTLDEDVIRIPLIARVPGLPHRRVKDVVSLIDIVPTVLALTKTPSTAELDGEDLAPLALGSKKRDARRVILTDTWAYDANGNVSTELVSAHDGRYKAVLDRRRHFVTAFDLRVRGPGTVPVDAPTVVPLARAIFGYLDETGGALRLGD